MTEKVYKMAYGADFLKKGSKKVTVFLRQTNIGDGSCWFGGEMQTARPLPVIASLDHPPSAAADREGTADAALLKIIAYLESVVSWGIDNAGL